MLIILLMFLFRDMILTVNLSLDYITDLMNPRWFLKGNPGILKLMAGRLSLHIILKWNLKPGESKDFIFVLGYVENKEDEKWESKNIINKKKAKETIAKFDTAAKVDSCSC